jgi:uncharacterized protein
MVFDLHYPIFGLIVGFLVGMTGMGGGAIMTPLLMLGMGFSPSIAVGTDLAYATLTKIAGSWQHWRQHTIDFNVVFDLALGSVPAALTVTLFLSWLHSNNEALVDTWLRQGIGIALLLIALVILYEVFLKKSHSRVTKYSRKRVIFVGAVGGVLVGLTSVGSGSLIMAFLVLAAPIPTEKLVGTDITHAVLLVGITALAQLGLGHIDITIVAQLLLGSIPGVLIGSRLTPHMPRRTLRFILAGLLVSSALPLLH